MLTAPVPYDAPSHWRMLDFISDLHLHASEPDTYAAWVNYLHTCTADALFILGDLFEVWVGDDILNDPHTFESVCAAQLYAAAQYRPIFIMRGNRDFLMGDRFAHASASQLLNDPTLLRVAEHNLLLTHGDSLCLADTEYQNFRSTVRSPMWKQNFLDRPLQERQEIAKTMRMQSESQKSKRNDFIDVDNNAAIAHLHAVQAKTMVHGHTHQPACHPLEADLERLVLSDWHVHPPYQRAEVLRLRIGDTERPLTWERWSPISRI